MSCSKTSNVCVAMALVVVLSAVSVACAGKTGELPVIGVYGGANNETVAKAAACGVDILFPSITWYEPNDWMKGMVERSHRLNMKVYPSLAVALTSAPASISARTISTLDAAAFSCHSILASRTAWCSSVFPSSSRVLTSAPQASSRLAYIWSLV